jgi:hypothetical protein
MGEWRLSSTIIDLGTGWRSVGRYMNLSLYPREKSHRYQLDKRLGGSQTQSGHCGEEKNLLPLLGIEPPPGP